ncbi:enoyl-CoA hydratase/isomerase family protein [Teladorsagia circumcincta]|uniref:Enoyl-CoA hydratase/isomerase family protein n=1 Tax=Teladorsagia circumcincta TaxID=45464 RepID=A0A2G9UV39_TELCI|nr:enoyl-CoA hydratase/isomerase family protein [Teladorsagia circumcincta]
MNDNKGKWADGKANKWNNQTNEVDALHHYQEEKRRETTTKQLLRFKALADKEIHNDSTYFGYVCKAMHRSITNLARRSHPVFRFLSSSASVKAELEVEEASSHVYHVKLNRPDRRNTFTMELWKEMKSTFDRLSEEPKCRAIVISGNGKSFCAGIDLQQGMGELIGMLMNDDIDAGRKGRALRRVITTCQDGFTAIEACPKPVIAAIHSHCIGAGVDLIAACDIRYASSDAMFSIRVLNHARDHTIRDSLDFVKTWNMSQMQATDLRNGAMAAMNKQKPEFENV